MDEQIIHDAINAPGDFFVGGTFQAGVSGQGTYIYLQNPNLSGKLILLLGARGVVKSATPYDINAGFVVTLAGTTDSARTLTVNGGAIGSGLPTFGTNINPSTALGGIALANEYQTKVEAINGLPILIPENKGFGFWCQTGNIGLSGFFAWKEIDA